MGMARRRVDAIATAGKSTRQLQFPTSTQMDRLCTTHAPWQQERVFDGPRRLSEAECQFWNLDDHLRHGALDDNNHFFSDSCSIRLSISCPTASPGINFACNFVLASASRSPDSCGRTYGRLGFLMLLEVFWSEVDLICFPAYVWEVARRRVRALLTAGKNTCQLQFPTSVQIDWHSTTAVP